MDSSVALFPDHANLKLPSHSTPTDVVIPRIGS
jgi:hypothetical protein